MGFIWFSTCSLPCWTDGWVCMISKQLQHISPQMMQQINKHFKISFPDESIQYMTMTAMKKIQLKSTSTSLSQNSKFCRQNSLWYQGNYKPWALNLNKKQNKQPQGPSGLGPRPAQLIIPSTHQPLTRRRTISACRKLQPILQSARLVGPACCASQFVCPLPRSPGVVPGVRHEWCLQGLGPALQNRQFAPMTVAMTPEQQLSTFNASGARALNHAASQAAM